MLSINEELARVAANSTYGLKPNPFIDRWKFEVQLPHEDLNKLLKEILDIQFVDWNSIGIDYTPYRDIVKFEVTDNGFAEYMKLFIQNFHHVTWPYTIDHIPGQRIAQHDISNDVKKEDIKMPKVKTQAPTHYPSFRKFAKVIRSGPVTVAWIEGKKFLVRKTKKDKDDPEKAMLMLFAKSQFSSEAAFHRWFRDQMKLFEEAKDNAKN